MTFSVVVPAYNAEVTLPETLNAISAQSLADWECVVVDDGSTDGTLAVAQELAASEPRLRIVHQENRGSGGAYNAGVRAATGDWVTICSADDVLLPEHLRVMARAIDSTPGRDIYSCNGYYWYDDGRRESVYPDSVHAHSWTTADLLRECFFSVGACYRRTLFGEVGGYEERIYGEDYDFWLRAMAGGATHWYVPEKLALHRVSASQKTADVIRVYESDIRSISRVLTEYDLRPDDFAASRRALRHRQRLIVQAKSPDALTSRLRRFARQLVGGRQIR
ncbi:MAG: glycosyltransferase family 2 protein [Coriobacteriia bacterium]